MYASFLVITKILDNLAQNEFTEKEQKRLYEKSTYVNALWKKRQIWWQKVYSGDMYVAVFKVSEFSQLADKYITPIPIRPCVRASNYLL